MNFHRTNFTPIPKPPPRSPKPKRYGIRRQPRREEREGRLDPHRFDGMAILKALRKVDEAELERVRKLPCANCGARPGKGVETHPHHYVSRGARGGDDQIIPLCAGWKSKWCHARAHSGEIPRAAVMALVEKLGRTK